MVKEIVVNLLSSPVIWGVIAIIVFVVVKIIVSKTKTTKDDEIFNKAMGMIVNAFNVAEKWIPDGSSGNMGKVDVALKKFIEEYTKREGKAPTEDLINFAKDQWATLAFEAKKKT